ncbi:lamin tail domain-containing protein [Candidatus Saccharibacteria bacterium]|nr:lamin tail domain-containing protein [Candidatus Saccharibacteria bacterium]
MKSRRYAFIEICLVFLIGMVAPVYSVFAEENEPVLEPDNGVVDNNDEEHADDDTPLEVVTVDEEGGEMTNIVISSYNPGFSDPYVGEFFELKKLSKNSILLAGLSVIYETSTGSEYLVYEFLEGDEMIGESLLLRLISSNEAKEAEEKGVITSDATYARNMSQSAGRIKLIYKEKVIDSLCWGLDEVGCYAKFNTKKPTTLVRDISAEELGDFVHTEDYAPQFNADEIRLKHNEPEEEIVEPKCRGIEFSEIFTYYESVSTEQFIELFNREDEDVELTGCFLKYKNNNYALFGTIKERGFLTFYPVKDWGIALTKNPTSSNKLQIIDTDGEIVDTLTYYSGQRKGVSLMVAGYKADGSKDLKQTYSPTPGSDNSFQQFKTCPVGKVINLETGNCVNESAPVATLAACPEGKYRNPLTGRCKSYESSAGELKPCAEGYERNPETNRCRKIVANTGAGFPTASSENIEERKEMTSVFTIATIVAAGIGYIAFQYKDELKMKLAHGQ